jgi:RNA polymerase sigma-70 factor (ECF subfamily)
MPAPLTTPRRNAPSARVRPVPVPTSGPTVPLLPPAALERLAGAVAMAATPSSTGATTGGPDREPHRAPGRDQPDPAHAERVSALVELAQAGDADAFGQIYELYVDTVYRYVYLRVGSVQQAEDITAETFVRALRRLDSFSWQGRDIAAWFITIARNLVTDLRRSSRFRLEVSTDEIVGAERAVGASRTGVPGATTARTPEQEVLDRARDHRLVEAVRTLRPEQQECLVLRFFHELSVAETAQALGRSEGAVKQLQLRAVRRLAEVLGDRP